MLPSSDAAGVGLPAPETEALAGNAEEPLNVPPLSVKVTVGVAWVMLKVVVEAALA